MTWYLCRLNHKRINQIREFALEEEISVKRFQVAVNELLETKLSLNFPSDIREDKSNSRLNCRVPGHFGPPHLHVSGGFEDRGITQ